MQNLLKERMRRGLPAIGGWLTIPSPAIAEVASTGSLIAVDMEHAPCAEEEMQGVFMAIEAAALRRSFGFHARTPILHVECWTRALRSYRARRRRRG